MRCLDDDPDAAVSHVCGLSDDTGTNAVATAATLYLADELRKHPLPCGAAPHVVTAHYERAKHRAHNRTVNDVRSGVIKFDPISAITLGYYLLKLFRWIWEWMNDGH